MLAYRVFGKQFFTVGLPGLRNPHGGLLRIVRHRGGQKLHDSLHKFESAKAALAGVLLLQLKPLHIQAGR